MSFLYKMILWSLVILKPVNSHYFECKTGAGIVKDKLETEELLINTDSSFASAKDKVAEIIIRKIWDYPDFFIGVGIGYRSKNNPTATTVLKSTATDITSTPSSLSSPIITPAAYTSSSDPEDSLGSIFPPFPNFTLTPTSTGSTQKRTACAIAPHQTPYCPPLKPVPAPPNDPKEVPQLQISYNYGYEVFLSALMGCRILPELSLGVKCDWVRFSHSLKKTEFKRTCQRHQSFNKVGVHARMGIFAQYKYNEKVKFELSFEKPLSPIVFKHEDLSLRHHYQAFLGGIVWTFNPSK